MSSIPTLPEIDAALKSLESIIGQAVFLAERPAEEPARPPPEETTKVTHSEDENTTMLAHPTADSVTSPPPDSAKAVLQPLDETAIIRDTLPYEKLKAQDLGDDGLVFCPWKLVLTYPDNFVGKANRPRVRIFFDDVLSYRDWNFFYVRDARDPTKVHLLVPTKQVHHFLEFINGRLRTELNIPRGPPGYSFCISFSGCGSLRPRYLLQHKHTSKPSAPTGVSGTDDESTSFNIEDEGTWPRDGDVVIKDAWAALTTDAETRYKSNMALLEKGAYGRSKKSAEQRLKERQERRVRQIRSMFEHLGLGKGGAVASHSDVVFFCVDVEAMEVYPNHISEIGIALLDMQQVQGIGPGRRGDGWWPMIQAHHLRIKEYAGLTNYRYVQGCPEEFQFGESSFTPKAQACEAVRAILWPYVRENRRFVLVGHDIAQDINYLCKIDFDVKHETNRVDTVDSQVLHQAWSGSDAGRSLSTVLHDLQFEHSYLHNAGNDAVHTLRVAIGVAFAVAVPREEEVHE